MTGSHWQAKLRLALRKSIRHEQMIFSIVTPNFRNSDRLKLRVTLMALSNNFGALVLATGNQPGMADVDCRLYGNIPIARRVRPSR